VPQQISDSEGEVEFRHIKIEDEEIPIVVPPYMPPRKSNGKRVKKPKDEKLDVFTPLL